MMHPSIELNYLEMGSIGACTWIKQMSLIGKVVSTETHYSITVSYYRSLGVLIEETMEW